MATTIKNAKSDRDFKVMFGHPESAQLPLPSFTVLITPSVDTFNDFGFRTLVDIVIRFDDQRPPLSLVGLLGFSSGNKKEQNDVRRIEQMLGNANSPTVAAGPTRQFFTMLPEMDAYRRFVRDAGPEVAGTALLAMNDLVALTELSPASTIPEEAERTSVFQKSFIRTAESFFAYKNAGSILRGVDFEEVGRMSQHIGLTFRLAGCKNEHELRFRFDHQADLPKRIAVIIGKNGVGKSQALGNIVRAALSGDGKILRDESTNRRVLMNRLLAFAPTNESNSVFPGERRRRAKVYYRRFALNRSGRAKRGGLSDLILQIARSDARIGSASRWRIFMNALSGLSDSNQLCLFQREGKKFTVLLSELRSAQTEHRLLDVYASIDTGRELARHVNGNTYPLSSGEISFVRFAAQASLYIENGSLLLLDEPETHLHPNFISQFVALLDDLLSQTGSAAIITTHSVYFVREVFREQVTVLRVNDDRQVLAEPIRLQTFGADVGAISDFVFGEDGPSKLAAEVERRLLANYSNWHSLYERYKNELSPEMLSSLRLALDSDGDNE
ncbi:AAA family ATPase [Burkholderia vietnamiensis]|uniref:AAA family ATPase n=1 Tax=Burkholderia vietnamiensis TaxID=60552 RepID=UPI000759638F|nr:AAA family ATPase [Burkholderia vietnamiensis]KVE54347.1 hypothetical protein WI94_15490 [Burkholderia vietnamiensis]MDN7924834.1 AAA family ATPase [Burkholderia vietnamiensis]HDR9249546.1 AAA family ATPase [Burkholderia vietnamiensis]